MVKDYRFPLAADYIEGRLNRAADGTVISLFLHKHVLMAADLNFRRYSMQKDTMYINCAYLSKEAVMLAV